MNNKYVNRAKISEAKFRELLRFFSLDLNAIQIAKITQLNRNTVNRYLKEIRKKIDRYCTSTSTFKRFNISVDEETENSFFVILIKESSGFVAADLYPKPRDKALEKKDWVHLFEHSEYHLLIDLEKESHYYLANSPLSSSHRIRVNRIENFWSHSKTRLAKFKGLQTTTIRYHLRECEFRYNNRDKDIYNQLLKIIRNDPLF